MHDIPHIIFADTGTITAEQVEAFRKLWKEEMAKPGLWKTPIITEQEKEYHKVKLAKKFVKAKNKWRHIVL
jgi:hypothetical protein